jgi:hypothetical protein
VAVPWRYQARCPLPRTYRGVDEGLFVTGSCEPTTTVSGLSSRPDCSGPAITRPVRQFDYSSTFTHSAAHFSTQMCETNRIRFTTPTGSGREGTRRARSPKVRSLLEVRWFAASRQEIAQVWEPISSKDLEVLISMARKWSSIDVLSCTNCCFLKQFKHNTYFAFLPKRFLSGAANCPRKGWLQDCTPLAKVYLRTPAK